jgi:arginine decarboxylase-like protein
LKYEQEDENSVGRWFANFNQVVNGKRRSEYLNIKPRLGVDHKLETYGEKKSGLSFGYGDSSPGLRDRQLMLLPRKTKRTHQGSIQIKPYFNCGRDHRNVGVNKKKLKQHK